MSKLERRLFIGFVLLVTAVVSRGPQSMQAGAPHYVALSHSIAHDELFADESHFTEEGHIAAAAFIAQEIKPVLAQLTHR